MNRFWHYGIKHPLVLIGCAAILYTIPLYWYLSPRLSDNDFIFYRLVLTLFTDEFSLAQPYPRWLQAANDGLGSPVFLFLGPGAYYPALFFAWLSDFDSNGTLRFILSVAAARILAGWLCYRWLRLRFEALGALAITSLYLLLPYQLHELYVRTELAGQWAYVWIFASLIGLEGLISGQKTARSFILMTLALALLIFTHLPTFITFAGFPFLYAFMLRQPGQWKAPGLCFIAFVLACGIGAFYWLPAMENRFLVNADYFTTGEYAYYNNFFKHPSDYYYLGYFLFISLLMLCARRKATIDRLYVTHYAVLAIVMFLLTPLSLFVWKLAIPLHFLQFPFRFVNIGLIPLAILLYYTGRWLAIWPLTAIFLGGMLFFQVMLIILYAPHTAEATLRQIPDHRLILTPEYRTHWNNAADTVLRKILAGEYRSMPEATTGQGTVDGKDESGNFRVNMHDTGNILFKRFYLPNIEVKDKTTGTVYLAHATDEGLLAVTLPKGGHVLQARMVPFPGEAEGRWLSLSALLTLAAFACVIARRTP